MSKTKLAVLVFCVAFGLNGLAFLFSKKSFMIEEVKSVWLYELPQTISPFDAYPATLFGPHNGVIGTLFLPGTELLQTELAQDWTWRSTVREFKATLRPGLTFSDGSPITADQWVRSLQFMQGQLQNMNSTPEWASFSQFNATAPDAATLILTWQKLPPGFQFDRFAQEVLTHPVSGVYHAKNLERIQSGERIVSDWISSGPYKVRKWRAKEVTIVSRDHFPVQLPKEFFRTLRYQSAPVKNPSSHFMQSNALEVHMVNAKPQPSEAGLEDHRIVRTQDEVHVFWLCRSWKQPGSFCSDPVLRAGLASVLANQPSDHVAALKGKTIQYRIPFGSDPFRMDFRKKLESGMLAAGGSAKEVSYFFKESKDADLELSFVTVPAGPKSGEMAAKWLELSTRVGSGAWVERNIIGEISKFPLMVLMKDMQGDPFKKVFLEPDLEEKKLPL